MGVLSTYSVSCPPFPFGSLTAYATDAQGNPLFFFSSLASHTRNLQSNHHASLFIFEGEVSSDPLASPRVTLLGPIVQIPASDAAPAYLTRHPNAKQWQDFSDFAYYRMEVSAAYYIAGFGSMGWISANDYHNACPTI